MGHRSPATGVDIAAAAIRAAEHKPHRRGLTARFLRHDVRRLTELGKSFDTVLDSGLLVHVLDSEQDRSAYLTDNHEGIPMPILDAQIHTERAGRYLGQFCKHAAAMGDGGHTPRIHLHATMARREVQVTAEWSDTSGTVTFIPWGRCILAAAGDTLTLRIDAADEDGLTQIRDIIDRDFERFSRRDPVTLSWQQPDTPGAAPFPPDRTVTTPPDRGRPRTHRQTILLALAAVLVIALHIGLAGTAVAHSRWTGIAVNILAALLVLKIALLAWARLATRRRRTDQTPAPADREHS